jgi:hypothetical protein
MAVLDQTCAFNVEQFTAGALPPTPAAQFPHWDLQRRELWMGHVLVKSFRVPAENQEAILTAFQEDGWPSRIDDPLPQAPKIDPKRRLHSTIQCLNRNRKAALLHFHGDGRGIGVRWVFDAS